MSWADVVASLAASKRAAEAPARPARRPPSTAGTFTPGCTPDRVLCWLRGRRGRAFGLVHIAAAVGRPTTTVSGALHQLRAHGLVDRRMVEPARAVWWALHEGGAGKAGTDPAPSMAGSPGTREHIENSAGAVHHRAARPAADQHSPP